MIRKRTSEEIREQSMWRFTDLAAAKYNKGQEEHGGLLDETVTFEKLEEELIDGWFYIQSLRYRTGKEADSENVIIKGLQSRVFELRDENHRLKVANEAAEKEITDLAEVLKKQRNLTKHWEEIAKS
jgi:hypothetical protein